MANVFDKKMPKLIANHELASLFPSEQEYKNANYHNHKNTEKVNWILLPKIYNDQTNKLEVVERELTLTDILQNHLSNYEFQFQTLSSRSATEKLESSELTCVVSVSQTEKRAAVAYFTLPDYVYIAPRLIIRTESLASEFKNNQTATKLADLLQTKTNIQIAAKKDSPAYNQLKRKLTESQMQQLVVFEDSDYNDIEQRLLNNKIDGIIAWPSMFSAQGKEKKNKDSLTSLALETPLSENSFAYIACSKTDAGKRLVNSINKILADKVLIKPYIEKAKQQLDINSRDVFEQLLTK